MLIRSLLRRHRGAFALIACVLLATVTIPLAVYAAQDTAHAPTEPDIELISAVAAPDSVLMSRSITPSEYSLSSANVSYAVPDQSEDVESLSLTETSADTPEDTVPEPEEDSESAGFTVTVQFSDRDSIVCTTGAATLREILASVDYTVRDTDRMNIGLDEIISSECTVIVDTVEYREVTETEYIPYETITEEVQTIPRGTTQVMTAGVNGERQVVYTVEYVNGVETSRTKQYDYVNSYPVNEVILYGTGGVFYAPDGTAYSYSYCTTVRATYYNLGGNTASGTPVNDSVIATDPSVFPLGTSMYVINSTFDMGVKVACDTGGGVSGNLIDIWMDSSSPYYAQFASQGVWEMTAYILD